MHRGISVSLYSPESCFYLGSNHFVLQGGGRLFLGWLIVADTTQPFHAGGVCCGKGGHQLII